MSWLTLLVHIWDVSGSNLGLETGNPEVFCGYTQSLQVNAGSVHLPVSETCMHFENMYIFPQEICRHLPERLMSSHDT
jgi:hypothetical protein